MKVLKKIAIVLLCIIALPFLVALFVPRSYTVSVSETINQPKKTVYDYVRTLKNQKDYSVWVMEDPQLKPVITGTDGTVGAVQKWNSDNKNVGEGEQEITGLTDNRMDIDIRFKRPFEGNAKAANIFESVSENKTKVTSEFYSNEKYPLNLPSYLFGRKMIQEAQIKNLKNIKRNLEKS